jgi:hypothetical protein
MIKSSPEQHGKYHIPYGMDYIKNHTGGIYGQKGFDV